MAMSRKHYVLIAETLKQELELTESVWKTHEAKQATRSMAISLACALKRDNERFDIDRFEEACGLK
jgi:hypothetical protein